MKSKRTYIHTYTHMKSFSPNSPPTLAWHPFLFESSVKARGVVKMLIMLKLYGDRHIWVVFSLRVSADVSSWNVQVRPGSLA